MVDNPDEARNTDVIAGYDDKGKPMTKEQVEERTRKKLEADAEKSEKVKEQLKSEREEAEQAAEAKAKADKDFLDKQKKAAEKEHAAAQGGAGHPKAEQAPQGRASHR